MLISKFDLYKPEWIEFVFENRNKEYGAYDLRQHYANNMIRAMGITFLSIGLLFGAGMLFKTNHVQVIQPPPDLPITVTLHPEHPPIAPPIKPAEPPKPVVPIRQTQFIVPVVKADVLVTTPPPTIAQIQGAVGPVTTPGIDKGPNVPPDTHTTSGTGIAPAKETVYPMNEVQVMPEPVGGDKAWAKFLNQNLRFPPAAQEEGASGRVILSFIIERDGSLSNIALERAAGHGFDEEALRVLKLAKAWKPGMQNGQPVRVKFAIPISFQALTDDRQ